MRSKLHKFECAGGRALYRGGSQRRGPVQIGVWGGTLYSREGWSRVLYSDMPLWIDRQDSKHYLRHSVGQR